MRANAVNGYRAVPALMEVPDPQPGPEQVLIKVEDRYLFAEFLPRARARIADAT